MTGRDSRTNPIALTANALEFEARLLRHACFSPGCMPAKLGLLIGFGYSFGPWDLIPSRIPVFGHLDEAGFVLAGLILAHVTTRAESGFLAGQANRPTYDARLSLRVRSALLARFLAYRRRLHRFGSGAAFVGAIATRWADMRLQPTLGAALFTLLGYRLWWACRSPFARRRSGLRSLVVIGGSPRSGTTLLRSVLGRHPAMASLPETTVFLHRVSSPQDIAAQTGLPAEAIAAWQRQSRSQMEFIERFHDQVLERSGKRVWAEKTPWNVMRFGFVRRRFPHAKLVHIVRDGRDVVCSLRGKPFAKAERTAPASAETARRCALQWRTGVAAGLRFRGNPAYYELRYEDLVRSPEPTLRALMAFLDIPWDDSLLQAPAAASADPDDVKAAGRVFTSSIGRWRAELSEADRAAIALLTEPLLLALEYSESRAA